MGKTSISPTCPAGQVPLIQLVSRQALLQPGTQTLAQAPPTCATDIAPILQKNCVRCHRPDSVAPMSLLTHEEVRPWTPVIKMRTQLRDQPGVMPPRPVARGTQLRHRSALLVLPLPRPRQGHLRPATDQSLGRPSRRRQLTLVCGLATARNPLRQSLDVPRDIQRTGHLCGTCARARLRADRLSGCECDY
jgi:hypothetical protein